MTLVFLFVFSAKAQNENKCCLKSCTQNGWDIQLKAGANIGGFSPLPLPAEIREVKHYNPLLNGSLEGQVTKWIDTNKVWGISLGVRLEEKGMSTKARVKNYSTEIIESGDRVAGFWTGNVKTKVKATYLTFPILAHYQLCQRWRLSAGPYFSYRMSGSFDGYVYDGYLREGTPLGVKAEFYGDKTAMFDFSNALRRVQWGLQLGTTWQACEHLGLYADLNWGINDIFHSSFKTVTFEMYPIFLNVGFSYMF